jgi:hypothetical protein
MRNQFVFAFDGSMRMRQQRIGNLRAGKAASVDPLSGVVRGSLDQFVCAGKIVGRGVEGTQTRYGEDVDFPSQLHQVTHHLMSMSRVIASKARAIIPFGGSCRAQANPVGSAMIRVAPSLAAARIGVLLPTAPSMR